MKNDADQIESGTSYFDRLSLEEEQGRNSGGRTNVETTLILRADKEANRGRYESYTKQEIIDRQENLLSQYADDTNLWIDEDITSKESSEQLPSGFESKVYLSKDSKTVTKFVDYRVLDNTSESFIDNRISLNNVSVLVTAYCL